MALHGGYLPYGGTFLTFSDYSRNAIRMAALMKTRVVHVFTHDSIGVGEDGPTHQPIEHLATLRAIPGLDTIRPGDANEVAIAQFVSLRAWSSYMGRTLGNLSKVTAWLPAVGRSLAAVAQGWNAVDRGIQAGLPPAESLISHWDADVLVTAESVMHQQALVGGDVLRLGSALVAHHAVADFEAACARTERNFATC